MADAADTTSPAKPRRRWRRRLLRLFVGVVVGLLLVVVGVQIFLWTDYPRKIGISVAQKITGLRIEMRSLAIGWLGDTAITDLAVSLPLEDKPFLTVPRVDVKHTSLVGIVLTQDVVIRRAHIVRPVVDVRQDKSGAWNLQQALDQISGPAQNIATVEPEQLGAGTIYLPDVQLEGAVVHITTRDRKTVELKDVSLQTRNSGPLRWQFEAKAGGLADASGSVTPAGRWPHDAQVSVDAKLLHQLRPIIGELADRYDARVKADWSGERTATGVTGRLSIPSGGAEFGPVRAEGAAAITLDGGDVLVEPAGMRIDVAGVPTVDLAGGRVRYGGDKVAVDELRVRFAEGSIRLTGRGDLAAQTARVDASWERVAFPPTAHHAGRFVLDVANIWPGKPQVSATLEASGEAVGRAFDGEMKVEGAGERWNDARYVIHFPRTRVTNDRGISPTVEGTKITLRNTADSIELVGIEIPQRPNAPRAEMRGVFNFTGEKAGEWWLWSSAQAAAGSKVSYRGHINTYGNSQGITLAGAYAAIGDDVWANLIGRYRFDDPLPMAVQLDFEADPTTAFDAAVRSQMKGRLGASANLKGTLEPLNLTLAGHARSRRFQFRDFDLGTTDLGFNGVLLPDYVNVETSRLKAFGGEGWLSLKYPYFSDELLAQLAVERFDIKEVGEAVGVRGLEGAMNGSFAFNVPIESPQSLHGGGEMSIDRFVAAPLVATQRVRIPIRVRDEWVQIQPDATQAGGGRAKMDLVTTFAEPTRVDVKASLQDWLTVLPLRDLYARTGGTIDIQADLKQQSAVGKISLENVFGAEQSEIGLASLAIGLEHRTLRLEKLTGVALGGTIFGEGAVNLDQLEHARLSVGATNLSLDRLAQLAPGIGEVKGNLSMRLHAEPTRVERPLGPVEVKFTIDSDRATYKGVDIGNTRVRAFLDRDRLVLSDDPKHPNQIDIAGGKVRLWGRVSGVPVGATTQPTVARRKQQPSVFVQLRPDGLDIEQLQRVVDPKGKPVFGRVAGEITVFGNPLDYQRLDGDGRLAITECNLGNTSIFGALEKQMGQKATGRGYGDVRFRLRGGQLDVPSFSYFNSPVYATAALTLGNAFAVLNSPIRGYVIGTARPLKDIELPFLADLDKIGDALQRSATTLAVEGTVGDAQTVPSSLKAFGSDFQNLLLGQTKREQ